MKTVSQKFCWLVRIITLVTLWALAGQAQAAPSFTSVSPGYGPVGTTVTIVGTGFGASQGSSTLQFGTYNATGTWSDTQIVTTVPNMPIGKVYLTGTVGG